MTPLSGDTPTVTRKNTNERRLSGQQKETHCPSRTAPSRFAESEHGGLIVSQIAHAALSVGCPACKATAGEDCRTARKRFPVPRVQRGLNRALRDEYKVHERSCRALTRLQAAAAANHPAADTDVHDALLSCGCPECRSNVRPLARLLARLGVVR